MEFNRAKEILNAEQTYKVLYGDKPVWINNVDPRNNIAQITDAENNSHNVPVQSLIETDLY